MNEKNRYVVAILGTWGGASMILGNGNEWLSNGIGLALAIIILNAEAVARSNVGGKLLVSLLLVVSAVPTFYHFMYHEEIWRDNRPQVHLAMAQMALKYDADQVTTVLGRSFLYYNWMVRTQPEKLFLTRVKFDHFEKPSKPGVYVGLPGEFLGNRAPEGKNEFSSSELPKNWELLESWKTRDSVSFGNGDYIWTVRLN